MSTAQDDNPGAIAPPPVIALIALVIGAGVEWLWPAPFGAELWLLGAVLIAVSIGGAGFVLVLYRRHGTHPDPRKPDQAMITRGPFWLSRNPIYVCLSALLAGLGLLFDTWWILVMLIPFYLVIHYFVVLREEAYLERRFGEEYLRYKASVRRWI